MIWSLWIRQKYRQRENPNLCHIESSFLSQTEETFILCQSSPDAQMLVFFKPTGYQKWKLNCTKLLERNSVLNNSIFIYAILLNVLLHWWSWFLWWCFSLLLTFFLHRSSTFSHSANYWPLIWMQAGQKLQCKSTTKSTQEGAYVNLENLT